MSEHIISISTYGSHRVKNTHTGQMVSAQKIGYSSAASAVLLALYGDRARDVSSKQASYHYIQIDAEVTVRHGYILLKVSDAELASAEAITRQTHRPAVYRWHDDSWVEFPSLKSPDYVPVIGRSGPGFNPTGMRIVAAATGEAEAAVAGILVEKTQRSTSDTPWWWISGDTYPHRDTLKRWGGRWSKRQKRWYFIADELPQAVQQLIAQVNAPSGDSVSDDDHEPCSIEEASAVLGVPIRAKSSEPDAIAADTPPLSDKEATAIEVEDQEEPKIRVIKPMLSDDDSDPITTAVRQTRPETISVLQSTPTVNGRRNLVRIPQSACGELTGSITGNVWCYGYSVHEGICIYLNCGGPRMAVEAIRAKLVKGDQVNCVPWDAPSVELTAGEGNTGMYTAYLQNIPEAKFTSLILLHDMVTQPNYGGKSTSFILKVSEEQAMAQLRHHVTKLVKVPVFDTWTGYMWQAGHAAMLVRSTRSQGGVDVLAVTLDVDAWTRLITDGLATNTITLPPTT